MSGKVDFGGMTHAEWVDSFDNKLNPGEVLIKSKMMGNWSCSECETRYKFRVCDWANANFEKVSVCPNCNLKGWKKYNKDPEMTTPHTLFMGIWPDGARPLTNLERGIVRGREVVEE